MTNIRNIAENARILIVDDEVEFQETLQYFLQELGHKPYIATSGEEALILAPKIRPDLVLMDVAMSGINGFDACRQLKKNKIFSDTPVIFVTAKTETSYLAEGFSVGGSDYITKPIKMQEIEARVNTHLKLLNNLRNQESIISVLENSSESRSKNFTQMSHDLRSPLTAIIGYSEHLLEEVEEDENNELYKGLSAIKGSADYLHELINSILDLAKLGAGKMELNISHFSVSDFLKDIELTVEGLAAKNKNTIKISINDPSITLQSDAMRLKQILINLISNACKFTNDGEITLNVDTTDNRINFTVKDTGIGMTSDQMDNLFDEYHQADESIASKFGGSGLGLSICKQLSQLMHGVINVESDKGIGTTFIVSLPFEQ